MQPARKEGIPGRGVYEAPFLVDGHEALLAVNGRGVVRKVAKLLPGSSYERVRAALEAWLDGDDPVPKLELVRETPRPRARVPQHKYGDDYVAYRNRLITQLAQRIRVFRD